MENVKFVRSLRKNESKNKKTSTLKIEKNNEKDLQPERPINLPAEMIERKA